VWFFGVLYFYSFSTLFLIKIFFSIDFQKKIFYTNNEVNYMIVDIRCPDCGKLVAKKEKKASSADIYFYCTRCKQNFEFNNSALVADKN
jgi:phage FluMu protein Com